MDPHRTSSESSRTVRGEQSSAAGGQRRTLAIDAPHASESFSRSAPATIDELAKRLQAAEANLSVAPDFAQALRGLLTDLVPIADDAQQSTLLDESAERMIPQLWEKRLSADVRDKMLEQIDQALWLTNADQSQVLYVSPAFERIFGRPCYSFLQEPELFVSVVHPEDQARFRKSLQQGTSPEERRVFRIHRPDGSARCIRVRAFLIRDEEQQVTMVAGCFEDITARLQAEEQVRQQIADLSHMARVVALGEMAAELAHEVNQPLAAIAAYASNFSDLVGAGTADPQTLSRTLERIAEEAVRAGEITRRLKTFITRTVSDRQPLDINDLIRETLALMQNIALIHQTTVQLRLDEKPAWALVDGVQIKQVLMNLLQNAIEAMNTVEVSQRIVLIQTNVEEDQLLISVRDRGLGLTLEEIERAFEPYVTTKPQGLGMGLSISRTIINAHGGQLWGERNADGGMIFRMRIPSTTIVPGSGPVYGPFL